MGFFVLLFALGAGLIGSAAMVILLSRKPSGFLWLRVGGGAVLGWVGGAIIGFYIGVLLEAGFIFDKANDFEAYKALPLRHAACEGTAQQVSQLLRSPLSSEERRYIAEIARECTLFEPGRDDIFTLLIPKVYEVYFSGDEPRSTPVKPYGYCYILELLINRFDVQRLRQIKSLGLPLNCMGGDSYLQLHVIVGPRGQSEFAQNADKYKELISVLGSDLSTYRSEHDETLLDLVIERHDPFFIETALRLGIDPTHTPGRKNPLRENSPATVRWVLRKYFNSHQAPMWPQSLSVEEIARIDALIPPPSLQEINSPSFSGHRTLLHQIYILKKQPDGGAAFFRYLKDRGADLGLASNVSKRGFFGLSDSIAPALLSELQKLTDDEVRRMANPQVAGTSEQGEALWVTARKTRNRELQQFLCARLNEGCSSVR